MVVSTHEELLKDCDIESALGAAGRIFSLVLADAGAVGINERQLTKKLRRGFTDALGYYCKSRHPHSTTVGDPETAQQNPNPIQLEGEGNVGSLSSLRREEEESDDVRRQMRESPTDHQIHSTDPLVSPSVTSNTVSVPTSNPVPVPIRFSASILAPDFDAESQFMRNSGESASMNRFNPSSMSTRTSTESPKRPKRQLSRLAKKQRK
jgi:hypothetical protein